MRPAKPRPEGAAEQRLVSGKAVAAALLLAAVIFVAAAVFLWVLLSRGCA